MIDHTILRLLDRRGVWMSAVEIFDGSPDYPIGDYVLKDLDTLSANGLLVARRRRSSTLTEYGLPAWPDAKVTAPTLRYLAFLIQRLLRKVLHAA